MIPKNLIEKGQYWTDSLTLVSGCSAVSEGCAHCWSAAMASRFPWGEGFAKNGKWTGVVRPNYKALEKLERRATSTRKLKPRVWQIWNDLFNIDDATFLMYSYHGMINCTRDIFLILTKRPENISRISSTRMKEYIPSNIYIGVSVESQKHVNRIDQLIENWPGKKFVSIEPCLGAVDLSEHLTVMTCPECGTVPVKYWTTQKTCGRCMEQKHLGDAKQSPLLIRDPRPALDQVIIGGESGQGRREPPNMSKLHSMLFSCIETDTPVFLKQWEIDSKLEKMPYVFGRRWDQLAWNEKGETG